jgi:glycosyltransferase
MIQNHPLISIITVVLNRKDTIEETIKSVLGQTYKNIEYIIVDGGSTNGTLEIIEKYKEKIRKFISGPDQGVFDAMNKGIKISSGEIIGFLNADDFYASNDVIEKVVETFEEKNVDCLWGELVYVDRKNTNKVIRYWQSSEYQEGKFKKGWMPPHPTFFVKKWVYEKYGLFNLNFPNSADYEIMLRFLERYKISSCYIPQIFVKMRMGGQSNKNLVNIIKGNIECYRAFKVNGLKINPLIILLKPLSKILQYKKIPNYF